MISSPGLPLQLNQPAANDVAVKFQWPTERDERLRPLETGRFSQDPMTWAGLPSRFTFQFDLRELSDQRSEQPFALGAPFGKGLAGFHFSDFGPVGQEFAWSQVGDQQFGGFVPLSRDFGGFGRFGNNGSNGLRSRGTRENPLASAGAAGGNGSVDLTTGIYNPLAYSFLYDHASWRDGSQEFSTDGFASAQSLADLGSIDRQHELFDFRTPILGLPLGIVGPILGPIGPIEWGFWLIAYHHHHHYPCHDWDWCPPPYSGCGPFDHGTPILGLPLGIVGPILGPFGPFDWKFWLIVHHHHHHHPHCVPAPSSLVMLLSLIPNLGLAYGMRRFVRARRGKKSVA